MDYNIPEKFTQQRQQKNETPNVPKDTSHLNKYDWVYIKTSKPNSAPAINQQKQQVLYPNVPKNIQNELPNIYIHITKYV